NSTNSRNSPGRTNVRRIKPIKRFLIIFAAASAVLVAMSAENANAQTATDKKELLNKTNALLNKVPAQHQARLSSGMQRIQQLAQVLNASHSKLGDAGAVSVAPKAAAAASALSAGLAPLGPITVP